MKTGSDIKLIYDSNNDCHLDAFAAIADAWNADLDACTWREQSLADNYTHSQQALQKARKQLRKLRQELVRARKQCDHYSAELTAQEGFNSTLVCLIERITKGNQ